MSEESLVARPLVSVTILNYNYKQYVHKAIETVLSQSYQNIEVIVVDDASTDGSLEIISKFERDPRVRVISHDTNQGYVSSLLEGSSASTGKYITVVSADDYAISDTAIGKQVEVLESSDNASFCFSSWNQEDDDGNVLHTRRPWRESRVFPGSQVIEQFIESSPVLHSGTMIRRSIYERVGGYDRDLRFSVDTNMWLKLLMTGDVGYVDEPLFAYRTHSTNLSQSSPAIWTATEEMLIGIDRALHLAPAGTCQPELARLRKVARKRALVAIPTLDIFSGRIRRGWVEYWHAVKHHPVETLVQRRGLDLLLRTLFGDRGFRALRRAAVRP